jgi:hypothetical protein
MLVAPQIIDHPARDHSSRAEQPIKFITVHATAGTNSLGWLSGNENGTSIHILIRKDGVVYKMVDETRAAHHVGFSEYRENGVVYSKHGPLNCNMISLGIELENTNSGRDPYPEAQLRACAWYIQEWRNRFGNIPVNMHRDIDTNGKTDAAGIQVADILKYIEADQSTGQVTPQSTILAAPRATIEQAIKYIVQRGTHPTYTGQDVSLICEYYWKWGVQTGVDPLLAVAQMIHETGNLTSWWCQRPRRNPAGIGVTGESKFALARPGVDWQWNGLKWVKGYAFVGWQDSAQAHIGHLLLYALPLNVQESQAQGMCILVDPRRGGFPIGYRGAAAQLIGLNGRWAVPGTFYADALSAVANAIKAS